jgi:hypothetical protein
MKGVLLQYVQKSNGCLAFEKIFFNTPGISDKVETILGFYCHEIVKIHKIKPYRK